MFFFKNSIDVLTNVCILFSLWTMALNGPDPMFQPLNKKHFFQNCLRFRFTAFFFLSYHRLRAEFWALSSSFSAPSFARRGLWPTTETPRSIPCSWGVRFRLAWRMRRLCACTIWDPHSRESISPAGTVTSWWSSRRSLTRLEL